MQRSEGRILTSHTGALFLPPRDDHGPAAMPTERAEVRDAVASIVAEQAEIGIDVVNNGDLTVGPGPGAAQGVRRHRGGPDGRAVRPGARDTGRRHGDVRRVLRASHGLMPNPENPLGGGGPERTEAEVCRGPIAAEEHRADRMGRRDAQAGRRLARRAGPVPHVPRPGMDVSLDLRRALRDRARADRRAGGGGEAVLPRDRRRGAHPADRRSGHRRRLDLGPLDRSDRVPQGRRDAPRRAPRRDRGDPRGAGAPAPVLGQLARAAHRRAAAGRGHRTRVHGARPVLLDRGRQAEPHARVARVRRAPAARRADRHAGRHRPHDGDRRAPAA